MPAGLSRSSVGARDLMSTTSRRRSLAEMLVCVVLVAALAVQPALGGDRKGKGKENRGQQVAQNVAAAPTRTAAPGSSARSASRRGGPGASAGRRSARQAQAAQDPAPAPPPAPADPAPVPPAPANAGGPEDGANRAPPSAGPTPAPSEVTRTPAPAPPPPAAEQPVRTPTEPESARPTTPAPATAVGAPTAERETVQSGAAVVTSQPPAPAAAAAPLAPPTDSAAAAPPSGQASGPAGRRDGAAQQRPRSDAGREQARGSDAPPAATDRTTGGTAPATALSEPLRTPATAAIVRVGVRETGDVATSRPRPTDDGSIEPLDRTSPIATALRDVVEVIPTWVWIALGALGGLVLLLGAHTILAAARTRRLERHREKLMEDIGLLQAALLPAIPARMGALLTTVAYRPADGPAAGGDFYDAFALPDGRVGLLLGDISGHGRQALAKTALVRFSVRAHLEAGMSPREAISIAGRSLDGRLADDFATVLAAIHDPSKGTLTYASAGHPPPLVLGPSAHAPVTASSAPPIGVGFPTGQRQTVLPTPGGTTVAIHSDGLLEARIDGRPLGADRLAAWLADLGPEATAKQLLDLVVQRADSVPDDLAAVVLHAAPGAAAPAARIEQLKLDVLDVEGPDLDGFLQAADVSRADRAIVGRRVSEQLAISGGVVVEVRVGEHPTASVSPIGDSAAAASRQSS